MRANNPQGPRMADRHVETGWKISSGGSVNYDNHRTRPGASAVRTKNGPGSIYLRDDLGEFEYYDPVLQFDS